MDDLKFGIIGGCGSSGSTLLMHVLNRHENICSGLELNLFNHKELYNYAELCKNYKKMISGKGASSGYFGTHWFLTEPDYYGIHTQMIDDWINNSDQTLSFVMKVCSHVRTRFNKQFFIEKTPSNVYCFRDFVKIFPNIPIIHIVRDGRDVVTSLMKRGFSLFNAGSRWLYDILCGLSIRNHKKYLEIKYEQLVTDPVGTLELVFHHLNIPFDPRIIANPYGSEQTQLYKENWKDDAKSKVSRWRPTDPISTAKVWSLKPTDPISTASISRYKQKLTGSDLSILYRISITEYIAANLQTSICSFGDLLEFLGYDINKFNSKTYPVRKGKKILLELKDYFDRVRLFLRVKYLGLPKRYTMIDLKKYSGNVT